MSSSLVKLLLTLTTFLIINGANDCVARRILGIFPFNARSHFMMFEALMKGLARRGHQVDVANVFPLKTPYPNYTDINLLTSQAQLVNNMSFDWFTQTLHTNIVEFIGEHLGNNLCAKTLEDPSIQRIIKNPPQNPPYDLVITESFSAHCFMAFGYHLNVPVVALSSTALYPWLNELTGNPENLAFVPNHLTDYTESMDFWKRLANVVYTLYHKWSFNYYTSVQDQLIRQHFGPDAPGVREAERNVALVLTNSHIVLNGAKPLTPAVVEVGGLHVQDDGPDIPAEHKRWLDESTDGFVYFTFGSMVTIESFPKSILDILYKSLGKISPVRVFMKVPHPEKLPAVLPKNIRTFTWMPQIKVLKHKNIRAFITHGGLMGTQEAIACAVPMIAMPLFGDQFANTDLYVKIKVALRLNYQDMTEEKLDKALAEVLYNPALRDTVKKISDRFLDQPLSAMDTACFWIEYVIRHGSTALRSPALDLTWWQIALLDIYAFLLLCCLTILIVTLITVRLLIRIIFRIPTTVTTTKKIN